MKNIPKRFIVPSLLVVIIILVAGIYVHDRQVFSRASLKSRDDSVRYTLTVILTHMQIYYSDLGNNSYIGFCTLFPPVVEKLTHMRTAVDAVPICNSSATAVAVSYPLFFDNTKFWCVDSTDFSGQIATSLGSNTVCPK